MSHEDDPQVRAKNIRRDQKRSKRRFGMKVSGKSVFLIRERIQQRAVDARRAR